jgi:hypothetical protein
MSEYLAELQVAPAGDEPVEDEAEEADETLPFVYEIIAYGADYPVDGLVKRIDAGDIYVPDFQRDFIWTKKQSDRFVESLLLGLPVPGIFLARDEDTKRLLVLDGQQRLRTLRDFYRGVIRGREFVLEEVQPRFRGRGYQTLDEDDRRRLDDSILHATVVRQDNPEEDQSSIYYLFERINTGGTALAPQEVRFALYQGEFNDLLGELNELAAWRNVYGKKSTRKKDQELILRFFAFKHARDDYERPMEKFLSDFMASNRHLQRYDGERLRRDFGETIDLVDDALGRKAFRPAQTINAAVFDAVMVGIAERLTRGAIDNTESIRATYDGLLQDDEFAQLFSRATADNERVQERMRRAIEAFAELA